MNMLSPDRPPEQRIAYRIAKVIAARTVEEDRGLRAMDGLGKASAIHTLAERMAPELIEEATAAYLEALKIQAEAVP